MDLHIHTRYSDGFDPLKIVIHKAIILNLDVISITDHETTQAYKTDEINNFKGSVLKGIEIRGKFENQLIDILFYGYKLNEMDIILNNHLPIKNNEPKPRIKYTNLLKLIDDLKSIKGKLFIAHPLLYKNPIETINKLEHLLDGIECNHPSANIKQQQLKKICPK